MMELTEAQGVVKMHRGRAGTFSLFVGGRGVTILVLPLLLLIPSCVSPVTWGPRQFGAGVFVLGSYVMGPDVAYAEARGVGVMVVDNQLCLGVIDFRQVRAEVEGRSYAARTPLAEFAVGAAAQEIAREFLEDDGGLEGKHQ
jgi:hypothetical protein